MFLKKLELINFRNYDNFCLDFCENKTLFIGKNAQGKTNILESVYYLSNLKSKRALKDSELILWDENISKIKSQITKNDIDIDLEIIINPPNKKVLKLNSIKKNKSKDFLGNLVAINFCIDDLMLIRGMPSDRRDWLDECISRIYPGYDNRLSKYNKIRIQRNNLLKNFKNYNNNFDILEAFDDQLVITGSNIEFLRLKYLFEIKENVQKKYSAIAPDENLTFNYNSTVFGICEDFSTISIEKIAALFKEKLKEVKEEEMQRMKTLIGPHRSDIAFFINDKNAINYASQGQQRTIVLSLKLAEIDTIEQKINTTPILLLDDVLAELDKKRQNYLLNSIENKVQTLITSTDADGFEQEFLKYVKIYKIVKNNNKGKIFEIS